VLANEFPLATSSLARRSRNARRRSAIVNRTTPSAWHCGRYGGGSAQQQGRQERLDMVKLKQLQGQLQDAQLNRQKMQADLEHSAMKRKKDQAEALSKQGHIESLIAGKTPQEQAMILSNPDMYVEQQMKASAPLTAAQQATLDQSNDQFQARHGLAQQTFGLDQEKLGIERDKLASSKELAQQKFGAEQAANEDKAARYAAFEAEVAPEDLATFRANPEKYIEEKQKAGFKAEKDAKLSGDQRKALLLGERADKALAQVDQVLADGFDPTSAGSALFGLTKKTQSQGGQTFDRAFRDAATAILRLESGAVIGDDEVDQFEKSFKPSYGDTEETSKQKMQAFRDYVANVKSMATATQGTANESLQGAPEQAPAPTEQEPNQPVTDYSQSSDDEISRLLKERFGG